MTGGALIAARGALMLDLALLMGLPLFWWVMGRTGRRLPVVLLALGAGALSVVWLLASTATMMSAPVLPPDWASAWMLLTLTPIGTVLAVRGAAILTVLVLAFAGRLRGAIVPAAVAAATLAWTGHAGATEAAAGTAHRIADVAHIWAAAGWIGALAVLLVHVARLRPGMDARPVTRMLARFALMGTAIVATLVASGAVNAVMIVGVPALPALTGSLYGALLAAKLALFALMLGLAGANRWWLTPALEQRADGRAIARLRLSLAVETSAAIAIIALVAWLGTLDPVG